MLLTTQVLISLLALLHLYFLILEMVLWTKPAGLKAFRMTAAQAKDRAVLAANQGLYNGFLAAGLLWSLVHPSPVIARELALFFAGCVLVAGLYGGYSASRKIYFVQALPAAITLLFVFPKSF